MPTTTEKKLSNNTLCSAFFTFKAVLVFIYEIIYTVVGKLLGKDLISPKSSINGITADGNGNITKSTRTKELWEIPGPKPFPFFGTLLTSSAGKSDDLMKVNLERESQYGPVVKEEHFWNYPLIMVLGTEEIKKIVKANFILRPPMEIVTIYRNLNPDRYNTVGVVSAQGDTWRNLHRIFAPTVLNMKFVRSLLNGVNEIASEVVDSMEIEKKPYEDLPHIVNKLLEEATFFTAFGQRIDNMKNKEDLRIFTNCHDSYWNAFHKSMYGFPWWKYFPTKVWDDFVSAEDKMIQIISEAVENLLADGSAGGILGSIPTEQLARPDLYVCLQEFILGATEPVYNAIIITLYWIFKNEQVYQRVLEELRVQLPTKDAVVDDTVLDNIPFLKACVMETYRICPTACNVARILEKEMELGGYRLPANTTVIAQTWHACLKDSNFYRAKEYLPERWLLQDGVPPFKPHDRQVMTTFGIGTRQCPGRRIATQLIHVFLCKFLRRYSLKFVEDLELRYEWLLTVKQPILVEIEENDF